MSWLGRKRKANRGLPEGAPGLTTAPKRPERRGQPGGGEKEEGQSPQASGRGGQ